MKINTQTGIILLAFIYIPNFLVHANAIDKINPVKNNIIVQENVVKVKRGSPVFNKDLSLQFNEMKLIKSTPEEIIKKLHILEKRSPIDVLKSIGDSASRSFEAFKPSDFIYTELFEHTNVGPQLKAGVHRNRKRSPKKKRFNWFTKESSKQKDSQGDRSGGGYKSGSHASASDDHHNSLDYASVENNLYKSKEEYKSGSHALTSDDRHNSGHVAGSRPRSEHIYAEIRKNRPSGDYASIDKLYKSEQKYKSGSHASDSADQRNSMYGDIPRRESDDIYYKYTGPHKSATHKDAAKAGSSGWKRPSGSTKDHSMSFQDELKAVLSKRRPH